MTETENVAAAEVHGKTLLAVLADPEVRKLWLSTLFRSLAVWVAQVALIVGVLRDNAGDRLAWVLLASTGPALLAGVAAGTVVDRYSARRTAQLAATASIGLLVATGFGLSRSLLLGTAAYALYLIAGRLIAPASIRLLYATLPPGRRTAGNAALGAAGGITTVVGAAIGGIGVSVLGLVGCFALAAALQTVAAATLWTLERQPQGGKTPAQVGLSFQRSLREGFGAVLRYPLATSIIAVGIAWGLIGGSYDVLVGIYGTRVLRGGGGIAVGLLYVADGLGVLAGAALAPRLPHRHQRRWYALAYVTQGALWALFAVTRSLPQALPALFGMRIASGVIIALDTTLLLATVPDRLHGRTYALHAATYGAVMRVSLAATGALLLACSPCTLALAAGAISTIIGTVWWLQVRRIATVDEATGATVDPRLA